MRTRQFKSESKKLMDMMINSIYTHKEIFLRELISNASDALDKLYFRSLTDNSVGIAPDDFEIRLEINKDARTLKIIDNGCGMTEDELDKNLGTIAKSVKNKNRGLELIVEKYAPDFIESGKRCIEKSGSMTGVYEITIEKITGKENK